MWLNERLSPPAEAELPHTGVVTQVRGNRVWVDSHQRLAEVACVAPFGAAALPSVGDAVCVLPGMEGYYCIGSPLPEETEEGTLTLHSPGGGYLRFLADGAVEINGAVITREGAFQPSPAGRG